MRSANTPLPARDHVARRRLGERAAIYEKPGVRRARPRGANAPYGATHPAEFFAVATEAFFEKPSQLRSQRPDLYEQWRGFYLQHPAARLEARRRDASPTADRGGGEA